MRKLGSDPTDLFFHALAILHAPAYREENAGALRMDWPGIPWPASLEFLSAFAALGRQVAALLDVEQTVPHVTTGKIPGGLRKVGVLTVVDGAPLNLARCWRWGPHLMRITGTTKAEAR